MGQINIGLSLAYLAVPGSKVPWSATLVVTQYSGYYIFAPNADSVENVLSNLNIKLVSVAAGRRFVIPWSLILGSLSCDLGA